MAKRKQTEAEEELSSEDSVQAIPRRGMATFKIGNGPEFPVDLILAYNRIFAINEKYKDGEGEPNAAAL